MGCTQSKSGIRHTRRPGAPIDPGVIEAADAQQLARAEKLKAKQGVLAKALQLIVSGLNSVDGGRPVNNIKNIHFKLSKNGLNELMNYLALIQRSEVTPGPRVSQKLYEMGYRAEVISVSGSDQAESKKSLPLDKLRIQDLFSAMMHSRFMVVMPEQETVKERKSDHPLLEPATVGSSKSPKETMIDAWNDQEQYIMGCVIEYADPVISRFKSLVPGRRQVYLNDAPASGVAALEVPVENSALVEGGVFKLGSDLGTVQLWTINGALLANHNLQADVARCVIKGSDGCATLNVEAYKAFMEDRLQALFEGINEQHSEAEPAFVSLPGVGLACFANIFPDDSTERQALKQSFCELVKKVLGDNKDDWPNIAAVHFDTYNDWGLPKEELSFTREDKSALVFASQPSAVNVEAGESLQPWRRTACATLNSDLANKFPGAKLNVVLAGDPYALMGNEGFQWAASSDDARKFMTALDVLNQNLPEPYNQLFQVMLESAEQQAKLEGVEMVELPMPMGITPAELMQYLPAHFANVNEALQLPEDEALSKQVSCACDMNGRQNRYFLANHSSNPMKTPKVSIVRDLVKKIELVLGRDDYAKASNTLSLKFSAYFEERFEQYLNNRDLKLSLSDETVCGAKAGQLCSMWLAGIRTLAADFIMRTMSKLFPENGHNNLATVIASSSTGDELIGGLNSLLQSRPPVEMSSSRRTLQTAIQTPLPGKQDEDTAHAVVEELEMKVGGQ